MIKLQPPRFDHVSSEQRKRAVDALAELLAEMEDCP
jgi:hypothetical protein